MRESFHFVEPPRRCGYLPDQIASLEIRAIGDMDAAEYGALLERGYRRFGWQVFRPACRNCTQCVSVRVLAQEFHPGARDRRVLRKNACIRAELQPLFVTREQVQLYNTYHRYMHEHRGWPSQLHTVSSYADSFLSGASHVGKQWMYFQADRLIGVAFMDEAPGAISLVYCFYDPSWRDRSPGTFSILKQLEYAKTRSFEYAYLGYWVESCPSMNYKRRFEPQEELVAYPADGESPVWTRRSPSASPEGVLLG